MKHLKLFENWLPSHKFTGNLMELRDLVWGYKQSPSVGDYSKVAAIKIGLSERPELLEITQDYIRKFVKQSEVVVFRGGGYESDAGWSTDMSIAGRFAADKKTDLNIGVVKVSDILYWDKVFNNDLGFGMDEDEIIISTMDSVRFIDSVDVGLIMEGDSGEYFLDDDDGDDDDDDDQEEKEWWDVETIVTDEVNLILKKHNLFDMVIPY